MDHDLDTVQGLRPARVAAQVGHDDVERVGRYAVACEVGSQRVGTGRVADGRAHVVAALQ